MSLSEAFLKEIDDWNEQPDAHWNQALEALRKMRETLPAENVEVLWRLGRASWHAADRGGKAQRPQILQDGLRVVEAGLLLDDKRFELHKWWAILAAELATISSTKEKIGPLAIGVMLILVGWHPELTVANALKMKQHADRANELHEGDAVVLHLLGRWCWGVASITWLERAVASALFGSPPRSSYEEALPYFRKAAAAEPKWIRNWIFVGDCHVQLKQDREAFLCYEKAADLAPRAGHPQDEVDRTEAQSKRDKLAAHR